MPALARSVSAARRPVSSLEANSGAQDFEGRSFPGRHHHMTMTSAAYAFRSLRRDPTRRLLRLTCTGTERSAAELSRCRALGPAPSTRGM